MRAIGTYAPFRLWAAIVILIVSLSIAAGLMLGGQGPGVAFDGSERFLTHISTDKPIYRAGEKVYVRGVMLHAIGHSPMKSPGNSASTALFEIKGPKGETVASGLSSIMDSVAGFSWEIPASQAGGEYTVRISYPSGDVPAERKFDVRAYRPPRLKSQIVFVRDGYGPGDTVAASLHVERAEGGVPAGAKVSVSARVDGEDAWNGTTTVDASGNARASFKLPQSIVRGEGVIAMIIQDGGTVETAAKTIPILLHTVDVAIYPEGGDLVAGLPNRVYVESRTPTKKPADIVGVIVNAAGREVATFRSEHEGRGRFSFVPARNEKYSLRVTEPAGIKTVFPLPQVKESGIVISSPSDVIRREAADVVVRLVATADGSYGVALSQRGKEFSFKRVSLRAHQATDLMLTVPKSLDGVLVATVYDDRNTPKAERLLFRQPEHSLKVEITPDRPGYVPGDKVTLRIATTDGSGRPVGAVVGVTVTDSSVLEMIEKTRTGSSLAGDGVSRKRGQRSCGCPRLSRRGESESSTGNGPFAGHTRLAAFRHRRNRRPQWRSDRRRQRAASRRYDPSYKRGHGYCPHHSQRRKGRIQLPRCSCRNIPADGVFAGFPNQDRDRCETGVQPSGKARRKTRSPSHGADGPDGRGKFQISRGGSGARTAGGRSRRKSYSRERSRRVGRSPPGRTSRRPGD
jgi:hypothetical protein